MTATAQTASFVPAGFDPADFSQIEPLYRKLLDQPIGSADQLRQWLADASELSAAVDEYASRRYIDKSCHTDDEAIVKRFLHFVENVDPKIKPLAFEMQKKFLACPHRAGLSEPRFEILGRDWKADVDIFRDENIPLETQCTKLVVDYDKLCGQMMVKFRGGEYTMQQMARFLEDPDRPTRQQSWEAVATRRMADQKEIESIFDKLLPLRQKIAANAGFGDFRAYAWLQRKRFDYSPDDCLRFADAIADSCVPVVLELNRRRAADLGVEKLRPWDLDVDVLSRPALRPFSQDQTPLLLSKTRAVFQRLSPELAADFDALSANKNLDLDSRKGKQPGGYQCSLLQSRQPFIFMNAAGLQRDVETLLHEGGHAFHFLAACRNEPLVFLLQAPLEFCEVASMSMELLGCEHMDIFYDAPQAARAKRKQIEGIIRFLPWMATIDCFQHWIYTHPGHTSDERTTYWQSLLDRFGGGVDWSGYEDARRALWQRQLHLFHHPFYYIEYGIAQLGALQVWVKSKVNPRQALANYRAALNLGGTRPLPELFAAAGIRFDFSAQTLRPLMETMAEELAALPR
jgi:oligoendopeptidase F